MKKITLNSIVPLIIFVAVGFSMAAIAYAAEYEIKQHKKEESNLIKSIMEEERDFFGKYLDNQNKYQIQILYTQIDKPLIGRTEFNSYSYNVDDNRYFYPASSVKLSACLLALDKINNLNVDGLNKYTDLIVEKGRSSQKKETKDSTTKTGMPNISSYIKKILVVSDNNSFDRLYEFLGQKYYNETLWQKGYNDALIIHRLGNPVGYEENKYTNPMSFYKDNEVIFAQDMKYNEVGYYNEGLKNLQVGKGYYSRGRYISNPRDFSKSNYMSIKCLQDLLIAVFFPDDINESSRFNLTDDDYNYLKKYLSMLPSECESPHYDYKDSYVKYFMYGGSEEKIPENIKIYNKIGCAYGYLVDNAYIVDENNDVEFLLTAVIYCNNNDILNDGNYNYYDEGMPFLKNLGRAVYDYEVSNK